MNEKTRQQCREFHARHPEVWDAFVRFTFEKINAGFKNYSAMSVFDRIRWETPLGDDGKVTFKINNNYRKLYAQRFMRMFPEHDGFFRTRAQ